MESAMVAANFPWLTVLVALPAAGAALLGFVPPLRRSAGRLVALAIALVELALGVYAAATAFNWSAPASYQLYESRTWIPQMGVTWSLGVTSLGLVMILLALALVPIVLVAGWDENEDRGAYPALVLALEAFMVLIFAAFDLAVFYVAFEAMLIPLYFMIGSNTAIDIVWTIQDIALGLLTIPNLIVLILLSPQVKKCSEEFWNRHISS